MEGRTESPVPSLPNLFEVLESPVHEAAAVPKEREDGSPDELHHLRGVVLVAFDQTRCLPCALKDACPLAMEGERHVTQAP